ncbi:MAG: ATP-binding protein [Synergistaceae bacterium]|nr:ATP-binding protein [Synergistaceae bacterium]
MRDRTIGRVAAAEKNPTTIDKFTFWTSPDFRLSLFDVVKVMHVDGSFTFGAVDGIYHITDSAGFLTNYIASDFGNPEAGAPTLRAGMNYAEAHVLWNTENIYSPVQDDSPVYIASGDEIMQALGLDGIKDPFVCGSLTMYEGTDYEITLPVTIKPEFILGPEAAHLNISGLSGLSAKSSFAMFLMKGVHERAIKFNKSTALVIFNVKGRDLMAIHRPNDSLTKSKSERMKYKTFGLSAEPFKNVKYYVPDRSYFPPELTELICGQLMKFSVTPEKNEYGLVDDLKRIQANDVRVIDIAKLSHEEQALVLDDVMRTIYKLKLGEYDNESGVNPPSKIIIFLNELNKFASCDKPVNPLLLDIIERGSSLGVILFGAEQFRSSVNQVITGNSALNAYGRTHMTEIETGSRIYNSFPETYKNVLTRLEQGEYLLQSPLFRTILRVKFPRPAYDQQGD